MTTRITAEAGGSNPVPLTRCSLTRADFETVLAALEGDAEEGAREDAQDVLQLRAPRLWLEALERQEERQRG